MSYRKFQVYFFLALLTGSGILSLFVFKPYLVMLAFGGVLAILFRPLYLWFLKLIKSATAAAFLSVLCVALTILIPCAYFFAALYTELTAVYSNVKTYFDAPTLTAFLDSRLPASVHDQVPVVVASYLHIVRGVGDALTANLPDLFSNAVNIVFGFFVILISVYYLLKDGGYVKKQLIALSPLPDEYDGLVFHRVIVAVRAVMGGVFIVGILKGVFTALLFWGVGIPAPLFWGVMTGLASFIPLVGIAVILVPAGLYLLAIGQVTTAIVYGLIATFVIATIDNFVQPKLVEKKTQIHPLLILLSMLGGFRFYGFSGFVLGPLTLSVTLALMDIYEREFRKYLDHAE